MFTVIIALAAALLGIVFGTVFGVFGVPLIAARLSSQHRRTFSEITPLYPDGVDRL